ncbi:MAG: efflux RND transporter permease subunit [Cellvibrionaceae bacterium]|nr:efflux RND transporter permease subunit [Cellvibrionaceae bacterium]
MIAWFTRNDVAANLLLISICLAGFYSLFNLIPLEFFPSFDSDRISVQVSLRGATPEDAELGIATRIEEAIQDLAGIDEYVSRSSEGGTSVTIEVAKGYNPRDVLDEVKSRVDAINTFPVDAERPIVSLSQRIQDVISVTVAGNVSEREIRELIEQVRDELLQISGITNIEIEGVRDYEIAIELSQDRLREYDLSLQEVAAAISSNSLDLSGGNLQTDGGDILLRSKGQAYRQNEFENIVLKTNPDGTLLRLADIAQVLDGFEEKALRTRFNGKLAATLDIQRVGKQSAIDVAEKVKNYVAKKNARLPDNLELYHWDNKADVIQKRINTLTSNAIQGGLLVILLLSLFLRPSVAFWVFLGIPVSFLGAFLTMPLLGVSLNMVSLFAFIVVLGIVVDDAIVTGENVYTHLQKSETGIEAAINGTKEVAVPVTFGVLTTVAAFLPLAFMEGNRGPIFAQIPLVVVPVLIFSLIESKFVLPAHLKHVKVGKQKESNAIARFQRRFAKGFEDSIMKYYQPVLAVCLRNKRVTLMSFSGLFICIVAALYLGHMNFIFFPRIPSENIRFNLEMPVGTPFEVTDIHMTRVFDSAKQLQDKYVDEKTGKSIIKNILTRTGGRGGSSHVGQARFQLVAPEERSIDIDSRGMVREWRKLIGEIPGADRLYFRAEIGRSRDPVDIQLRSNNLDNLSVIAEQVKQRLSTYEGVFDIYDSLADGKQELRIDLKPQAHLLGVDRQNVIRQVRQAFFGLQAQRIQRGKDDVRVMVRFPREERSSLASLNSLLINLDNGQQVPLEQIATITPDVSPSSIYRIDGYRTINVKADIEKTVVNMTVLGADLNQFLAEITAKYPGVSYKLGGEQEEQAESNRSLLYGLLALIFAIYCLLAIPFRSYLQPLVVMSIIPFGVIGAVIGHWLMGVDLTIMSNLGIIALCGVLVNDSLVLVDYINKVRAKGTDLMDAVLTAGVARFRPVMLTSLTTFFGLLPLLFEKETQAQFLIPMAISLSFGIIFATFITLLMVPVNYLILEGIKQKVHKLRSFGLDYPKA